MAAAAPLRLMMQPTLLRRRALAFALTMAGALALAEAVRPTRRAGTGRDAESLDVMFPRSFGGWQVEPAEEAFVRPAESGGKVYGVYDEVLERVYTRDPGERVMVSAVYGSEQSTALQLHRPEVCYAASGFRVSEVHAAVLRLDGTALPVTRLMASLPGRPEPATYWTLLGDRPVADAAAFRWARLGAGLAGGIPDGLLVRLSSVARDAPAQHALQERFALALSRAMLPPHRLRVFGA
jgi:EpsI family protein